MAVSHTQPVSASVVSTSGFGIPVSHRIVDTGTLAARPGAPGAVGGYYRATDTNQTFVYTGIGWIVSEEAWAVCTPRVVFGNTAYCYTTNNATSVAHVQRSHGRCSVRLNLSLSAINGTWTSEYLGIAGLPYPVVGSLIVGPVWYSRGGTSYAGVATDYPFGAEISGTGVNTTNGGVVLRCPAALALAPGVGDVVVAELSYQVAS